MLNLLAPESQAARRTNFRRRHFSIWEHWDSSSSRFSTVRPFRRSAASTFFTALLAASHRNPWYEYAATATAGSVIGAYITFRLARKAGSAYLDKKFKKGTVSKFLKLFKKWGTGTLAASDGHSYPHADQHVFRRRRRLRFSSAQVSDRCRPCAAPPAIPPSPSLPTTMDAASSACSGIPWNIGDG